MSIFDDDDEEEVKDTEVVEQSTEDTTEVVDTVDADDVNGQSIVKPADNISEVVEVYEKFTEIKEELLDPQTDMDKIDGSPHVNKSGWRKIATAFNVSTEVVGHERMVHDGIVKYRVKVKATAPNGKTVTGVSMCGSNEPTHMETIAGEEENVEAQGYSVTDNNIVKLGGKWRRIKPPRQVNDHNILTIAETRAKNRAISDLVGGGEVSAEEMTKEMAF